MAEEAKKKAEHAKKHGKSFEKTYYDGFNNPNNKSGFKPPNTDDKQQVMKYIFMGIGGLMILGLLTGAAGSPPPPPQYQ